MPEATDLLALRVAALAVVDRFCTASDDELLTDLALVEAIGTVVDSLRIQAAAQVEHRSRRILDSDGLAHRNGARDGIQLVQLVTRVSAQEAKRRVGIGAALAPVPDLLGTRPSRHPELAAALAAGEVGVEAARVIVNLWKAVHHRADPALLQVAMRSLLDAAKTTDEEGLREVVAAWDLALDPDGPEERHRNQRRKRALRIGRTLRDGTTTVTLVLGPEDLATLQDLLQSRRRGRTLIRTEAGGDDTDDSLGPEWRESPDDVPRAGGAEIDPGQVDPDRVDPDRVDPEREDPRSRAMQDHDTLMEAIALAARAETAGIGGTTTTHTVVITATAAEVEARRVQGWAAGIMAGLPMPVVERIACDGETRLLVIDPDGAPLHLGSAHRLFSPAQKLALVIAAGGRCQYPGCRTPHPYLEAHHARWWDRDTGPTDIDNGILLCSYHHHLVHAKDSPIEIRSHDGDLHIVPKHWIGPPDPHHRRQADTRRHPRSRPRPRPDTPSRL